MINNTYITKSLIGKGGSANVFLVETYNGDKFAAKVIKDKQEYSEEYSKLLVKRETDIMNYIPRHPNILQNHEVFYDSTAELGNGTKEKINCTILELAQNGTLSSLSMKVGKMEEFAASFVFTQILGAVMLMHDLGAVHCDIKPQNILFDEFYNVKLSDFGVSQLIQSESGMIKNRRGTQGFMAPELEPLQRVDEYDPKATDVYALGATLFYITCGEKNFSKLTWDNITNYSEDEYDEEHQDLDDILKIMDISDELKDLLAQMLSPCPELRPSAQEIQLHPWIKESVFLDPWMVYEYLSEI